MAAFAGLFFESRACMGSKAYVYVFFMCVRCRGEERSRPTGSRSSSGTHNAEGRGSAKIACGVAWSHICRCLTFGSCFLYAW